ncbi:MAG TPA: co-chaperone GroES [Elusimicrobia bacterium]|nr:MAG: co-chaperone GroES [Elusimicrobia bacterium GWA2_64_40]OGR66842.1 MAG: co-chaperone GroES [Elusimicrobia bacterium GWB2_63_16]HAN05162.1 co-chaperone GroES [Elusimicrobiota bacterium]HAU90357.1 co-chaperone GroES [Elusimicrobiota bacterium]
MKIQPLGDRLIVKAVEPKEIKKSGIIIPDSAKEKPQEGEVVAVGKGRLTPEGKLIAMEIKTGDIVLYGKYSGTEIKLNDEEYLIMREEDVLGIVK